MSGVCKGNHVPCPWSQLPPQVGVYCFETHACCAVELVELLVQMQTPESEPITLTYFLQVWPSLVALTQRTPSSVSLCSG